jgi:hypothetical protein
MSDRSAHLIEVRCTDRRDLRTVCDCLDNFMHQFHIPRGAIAGAGTPGIRFRPIRRVIQQYPGRHLQGPEHGELKVLPNKKET